MQGLQTVQLLALARPKPAILPGFCLQTELRSSARAGNVYSTNRTRFRDGCVQASTAPSASGNQAASTPEKGYAFLHDFCLAIPYGVGVAVLGAVTWLTGSTTAGVAFVSAGVLASGFSALSLQCYQAGKKSTPFTVASAGVSFMAAFFSWQNIQAGIAKVPSTIAIFLSAAISTFLVYNVAAGGNPPKGEKPLAEAAPHPVS